MKAAKMTTDLPKRRTSDLLKGRISLPGVRYFVTCSTVRPTAVLTQFDSARSIRDALQRLQDDGDLLLVCAMIMPDHVHLVFALGKRLSLERVLAKLKGLSKRELATCRVRWQENFFDHRLRPEELLTPYLRYVFMNPYRAGLVARDVVWPHWIAGNGCESLLAMLDRGMFPPEEWMTGSPELSSDVVGED